MVLTSLPEERLGLADARRRWGEAADPGAVARWFTRNAEVDYLAGCYGAALKDAGYARRIAREGVTAARALRVTGCVQLERGDTEAAIASLRESLGLAPAGAPAALARADLAFALAETGRLEEALVLCRAPTREPSGWALGRARRVRLRAGTVTSFDPSPASGFGWIQLGLADAELPAARGEDAAALALAGALIERMRGAGARAHLGDALLLRARALGALGRVQEQAAARVELRELALSLGSRRLLLLLG